MAKYRITKINSINGNLRGVYGITLKSEKNTYCLNCNCFIRLDKRVLKMKITDDAIHNLEKQTVEVIDFLLKVLNSFEKYVCLSCCDLRFNKKLF